MSNDLRANVEVADPRAIRNESRLIDIDQVRELSVLILRLEALSAAPSIRRPASPVLSPTSPTSPRTPSVRSPPGPVGPPTAQNPLIPPAYLGPSIREEMTDEELTLIIESLTTRAENSMSTLVIISKRIAWSCADYAVFQTHGRLRLGHGGTRAGNKDRSKIDPARLGHDEWCHALGVAVTGLFVVSHHPRTLV